METIELSEAQRRFGYWCRQALAGEFVAIRVGETTLQLYPMSEMDCAVHGITPPWLSTGLMACGAVHSGRRTISNRKMPFSRRRRGGRAARRHRVPSTLIGYGRTVLTSFRRDRADACARFDRLAELGRDATFDDYCAPLSREEFARCLRESAKCSR